MTVASNLAIVVVLVMSGLLACQPSEPNDTETNGATGMTGMTGMTSMTGTTGVSTTTTGTTGETTTPTSGASTGESFAAAECEAAGGICIGAGGCVMAGGSITESSPGGCEFADGPAECCIPPAAKPKPKTCADAGGLCAPIGGCLDAGGYFTSIATGCEFSGNFACCVPHDRCGEQTIECCTDRASFHPSCDSGKFVCMTGEPVPNGTCMPP